MSRPEHAPDDGAGPAPAPVADPAELLDLSLGHLYAGAIRAVARHRVADLLAELGPSTAAELARAAGLDAAHLRGVLRLLATRGVFAEEEPSGSSGGPEPRFRLTPAAELLREDVPHSQRTLSVMLTDEMFERLSARLDESVRTPGPSFAEVFGVEFFPYLMANPEKGELFDLGMTSFAAPVDEAVAELFPWPERGTVVDVGGGRGGLLRAVLRRHAGLTGVLFDRPDAVGRHLLGDEPELEGRWRAESGDFFDGVPGGGDVYVLKHVLHDWPDEDCLRILRACRAAAPEDARLLVVDSVIPPGNAPHPAKSLDVLMAALLEGRERTREEFAALLAPAGFRLRHVHDTGLFASAVEAVAARVPPADA
ncbi:O-methyltransferase [Streptomyces albiaxialis]|uniref:O-methyltransferase n=1 Tax=Streptomyces albiaxialis TaxID=329523 RepID=A0ABN2VQM2_9ACTN